MCGRYRLFEAWEAGSAALQEHPQECDHCPSQTVAVLTAQGPARMVWGLPRPVGKGLLINVRAETVMEKPIFRAALKRGGRCLVPASGFYEWQATALGKRRRAFTLADHPLFLMAGLYLPAAPGEPAPRMAILTTAANPSVSPIHPRMPLILDERQAANWLNAPECIPALLHITPPPMTVEPQDISEQLSLL